MTNRSKKTTKPKPQKKGRPLSSRKAVQASNRKLLDFFSGRLQELRSAVVEMERRIAESNQQLWNNQQQQHKGLGAAEEHVVLIRRVLNDALGGVTRVLKIKRRSQTNPEEQEEVQVIDWGWYAEQLHYSDDRDDFMNGMVLTEDEIQERAEKEKVQIRSNHLLYLVVKAAEKDEEALKKARDEDKLDEFLELFTTEHVEWEKEMHDLAPEVVENVLKKREVSRRLQNHLEVTKERNMLKMAVHRVMAGGEGELLRDPEQREDAVRAVLPGAVTWTPRMSENLVSVIDEAFKEEAKRHEENDPEEVEKAKQELLEKTKKFGNEAAEVIRLIEEGKQEEAGVAMAKLEQKVKDEEAEVARNAPDIPDGATVFGGS